MNINEAHAVVLDSLKEIQAAGFSVDMRQRVAAMVPESPDGLAREKWFIASISEGSPATVPGWDHSWVEAAEKTLRNKGIRFDTGGYFGDGFVRDWYLDHSFKLSPQKESV